MISSEDLETKVHLLGSVKEQRREYEDISGILITRETLDDIKKAS